MLSVFERYGTYPFFGGRSEALTLDSCSSFFDLILLKIFSTVTRFSSPWGLQFWWSIFCIGSYFSLYLGLFSTWKLPNNFFLQRHCLKFEWQTSLSRSFFVFRWIPLSQSLIRAWQVLPNKSWFLRNAGLKTVNVLRNLLFFGEIEVREAGIWKKLWKSEDHFPSFILKLLPWVALEFDLCLSFYFNSLERKVTWFYLSFWSVKYHNPNICGF